MKELLDGYVGVKFAARCLSTALPSGVAQLVPVFLASGERLRQYGMTPANGGNMSVRLGAGFAITASGCHLGAIEPDEVVYVQQCDMATETVSYHGPTKPSSESILHYLIYEARKEAGAVVHAHDPEVTTEAIAADGLAETIREEPYGTVALARLAIDTLCSQRTIVVLRNHGYVCIGSTLEAAVETVVETHERLLDRTGKR